MLYRLAIALGIVVATATAPSAQPTYRLQNNGELWVSRLEMCGSNQCIKWHLLDNDSTTREITAGGGTGPFDSLNAPPKAAPLYKRRDDGKIFRYTGKPCGNGSCQGWKLLDDSQQTVSIVAAGREHLYKRHQDGSIYGTKCNLDGSCPPWQQLDKSNTNTVEISAGGLPEQTELYKRHKDGEIWRYKGTPCRADGSCPEWELLDHKNPETAEIIATVWKTSVGRLVRVLYKRHKNGEIWRYCSVEGACRGWTKLDDQKPENQSEQRAISIVATAVDLYQLRGDGSILIYKPAQPCAGGVCSKWQLLDKNVQNSQIAAGPKSFYKRHENGAIWRYTGTGWQLIYDPTTLTIISTQN
jgi:hypothetical protein